MQPLYVWVLCVGGTQVPPQEALVSLNGAVVGLVVASDLHLPPSQPWLTVLPQLPLAPCVGLGVVRAIDPVERML